METAVYTALTIGLLGSAHCAGMCSGIVGALNAGLPQAGRSALARAAHHLTYNAGRIASYAAAGALAGLAGAVLARGAPPEAAVPAGHAVAGLFMVALGLYLAGWWHAVAGLERAGAHLWRRIEPLGRRFLPAATPARAFGLGLVWGWLPCGLVYSALVLAFATASPVEGALVMLAFGLGTLPALLAIGGLAARMTALMRRPVLRQVAGAIVVLLGLYTLATAVDGAAPHAHAATLGSESPSCAAAAARGPKVMKTAGSGE